MEGQQEQAHWDGCEVDHLPCALARLQEAREAASQYAYNLDQFRAEAEATGRERDKLHRRLIQRAEDSARNDAYLVLIVGRYLKAQGRADKADMLLLDKPDDLLFHASDRTWWRKERHPDGDWTLRRAEPPSSLGGDCP